MNKIVGGRHEVQRIPCVRAGGAVLSAGAAPQGIRKDRAPENFAVLRRIALALTKKAKYLQQKSGQKAPKEKYFSIRTKRLMAGWDEDFLLQVLFGSAAATAAAEPPTQPG